MSYFTCCGCLTAFLQTCKGSAHSVARYKQAKYSEREYSIEFENLIDEEDFYTPPLHMITTTERDLLAQGKFCELFQLEAEIGLNQDEKLKENENIARLEEEAYIQAKKEAAKVAKQRQYLNRKADGSVGKEMRNMNSAEFSQWLYDDQLDMTSEELNAEDFESFLERLRTKEALATQEVGENNDAFTFEETLSQGLAATKIAGDALNALQPVELHAVSSIMEPSPSSISPIFSNAFSPLFSTSATNHHKDNCLGRFSGHTEQPMLSLENVTGKKEISFPLPNPNEIINSEEVFNFDVSGVDTNGKDLPIVPQSQSDSQSISDPSVDRVDVSSDFTEVQLEITESAMLPKSVSIKNLLEFQESSTLMADAGTFSYTEPVDSIIAEQQSVIVEPSIIDSFSIIDEPSIVVEPSIDAEHSINAEPSFKPEQCINTEPIHTEISSLVVEPSMPMDRSAHLEPSTDADHFIDIVSPISAGFLIPAESPNIIASPSTIGGLTIVDSTILVEHSAIIASANVKEISFDKKLVEGDPCIKNPSSSNPDKPLIDGEDSNDTLTILGEPSNFRENFSDGEALITGEHLIPVEDYFISQQSSVISTEILINEEIDAVTNSNANAVSLDVHESKGSDSHHMTFDISYPHEIHLMKEHKIANGSLVVANGSNLNLSNSDIDLSSMHHGTIVQIFTARKNRLDLDENVLPNGSNEQVFDFSPLNKETDGSQMFNGHINNDAPKSSNKEKILNTTSNDNYSIFCSQNGNLSHDFIDDTLVPAPTSALKLQHKNEVDNEVAMLKTVPPVKTLKSNVISSKYDESHILSDDDFHDFDDGFESSNSNFHGAFEDYLT